MSQIPALAAAAARPGRPDRLRCPAARRAGPAEHQREPLPALAGAGQGHCRRASRGSPAASTATPTGMRSRCARTSPPTSATGSAGARYGRRTAPTRSSSSCCWPSAAPAGARSGSSPRTRCTRSSPAPPRPPGSAAPATATSAWTRAGRCRRSATSGRTWSSSPPRTTRPVARCRSPSSRPCATQLPAWSWWTRRTPSSPATGHRRPSRCCRATGGWSSPAPCPRRSRWLAPGWGTWPPTRRSSRRCCWSGCPTTCRPSPRRWPGPRWRTRPSRWPPCRPSAPNATGWWTGCAARGSRWPTRTRTSSCSASSATRTRSGRPCWSAGCWSGRPARPAGCG